MAQHDALEVRVERAHTPEDVHAVIDDIIRYRSLQLHRATSDITPELRKHLRKHINWIDDLLVSALVKLPDHRPEFPTTLEVNGRRMMLQEIVHDNAVYVTVEQWDLSKFRTIRIDPRDRVNAERSASRAALQAIIALERIEADPVEADEDEEKGALAIVELVA